MAALYVEPRNAAELKLVQEVLEKMNIPVKRLTALQREDIMLGQLISEADRSKKVSRAKIMKKLAR